MASVFSQINSTGASVTAGLRHVTKGDKSAPPVAAKVKAGTGGGAGGTGGAGGAAPPPAEGRKRLDGKKWMVEHFRGDSNIVLDQVKLQESVYLFKCENCVVQVKGKVNQITLDSCKKTQLVFDSVMAGFELVNSTSCKAQVTGSVGTINVEKSDGTQLILSKDAVKADIISAKSSELNIIVPGATDDDEYKEHAIPEQFISKYDGKRFITKTLEHTA